MKSSTINNNQKVIQEDDVKILNKSIKQVDDFAQTYKYKQYSYELESKKILEKLANQTQSLIERDNRRQQQLLAESIRREQLKDSERISIDKWKETQKVKTNRLTRDLQLELAVQQKNNAIKSINSNKDKRNLKNGIEEFEHILQKSGINVDDNLSEARVVYEDKQTYLSRISEAGKVPDEEVNDYLSDVKNRVRENRAVRLDRERRNRRIAVNINSATDNNNNEIDDNKLSNQTVNESERLYIKRQQKEEMSLRASEQQRRILDEAEKKLELFSYSVRLRCEQSGERENALATVKQNAETRLYNKHLAATEMVKEIVDELIYDVYELDQSIDQYDYLSKFISDPSDLLDKLYSNISTVNGVESLFGFTNSELWPLTSTVVKQLGRYYPRKSFNSTENADHANYQPRFLESSSDVISELTMNIKDESHETQSNKLCSVLKATDSELKLIQLLNEKTLPVPPILIIQYNPIFGFDGPDISLAIQRLVAWLGNRCVVWDLDKAIEAGQKLKGFIDIKNPVLDLVTLMKVFELTSPTAVPSQPVDHQVLKAALDVCDICQRIQSSATIFTNDNKNKTKLSSLSISIVTPALLVSLTIYLRNRCLRWLHEYRSQRCDELLYIVTTASLTSQINILSVDDYVTAKMMTWVIRGGGKIGRPEDISNLIDNESSSTLGIASSDNKSKSASIKKSKSSKVTVDDYPLEDSSVIAVVRVTIEREIRLETQSTSRPGSGAPLPTPTASDSVSIAFVKTMNCHSLLWNRDKPTVDEIENNQQSVSIDSICPYLVLRYSTTNSTDRESQPSNNLAISNDLQLSESLLSSLIISSDYDNQMSLGTAVMNTMIARQSKLKVSQSLLLKHQIGSNVFNRTVLENLKNQLNILNNEYISSLAVPMLCLSTLLFGICQLLVDNDKPLLLSLKRGDIRFSNLYSDKKQLDSTELDDLICRLGDVIDDRHVSWLQIASKSAFISDQINNILQVYIPTLVKLIGNILYTRLTEQTNACSVFSDFLIDAGYDIIPPGLILNNPTKRNISRKQTELRAMLTQISISLNISSVDVDNDWEWISNFRSSSLTDGSILSTVQGVVFDDVLETASAIINGTLAIVNRSKSLSIDSPKRAEKWVLARHHYEHTQLSSYSKQLRESQKDITFELSYSSLDDNIPSAENEFYLPSNTIRSLVIDFNDKQTSSYITTFFTNYLPKHFTNEERENGIDVDFIDIMIELLLSSFKRLTKEGVHFSRIWRSKNKLKEFLSIHPITKSKVFISNEFSNINSLIQSIRSIEQFIIASMVFAHPLIGNYPTLSWIRNLGECYGISRQLSTKQNGWIFRQDRRPTSKSLTETIFKDKRLDHGWIKVDSKSNPETSALCESLCMSCIDGQYVAIEELLVLLARFPFISISTFNSLTIDFIRSTEVSFLMSSYVRYINSSDQLVEYDQSADSDSINNDSNDLISVDKDVIMPDSQLLYNISLSRALLLATNVQSNALDTSSNRLYEDQLLWLNNVSNSQLIGKYTFKYDDSSQSNFCIIPDLLIDNARY